MKSITNTPGSPPPKNIDYQSMNPRVGLQSQTPSSLGQLSDTNLKRKHNQTCQNLRVKLVNRRNNSAKENIALEMKGLDPSIVAIGDTPIKWIHQKAFGVVKKSEESKKLLYSDVVLKSNTTLGKSRDPIRARVNKNPKVSGVVHNDVAKANNANRIDKVRNEKYLPTKNMYDILEDSASTTDSEDDPEHRLTYIPVVNQADSRATKYTKDCGSQDLSSGDESLPPFKFGEEYKQPYERSGKRKSIKKTKSLTRSLNELETSSIGTSSDLEGLDPTNSLISCSSSSDSVVMHDMACGNSEHGEEDSIQGLDGDHLMVHNFLHVFDHYSYNQLLMTDWSNLDHVSDLMCLMKSRNVISFEDFARCILIVRKPWNRFKEDVLFPLFSAHPLFADIYEQNYVLDLLEKTYKNGYPSCDVKQLGLNELPNIHLRRSRVEIKYPKKVIDTYYSSLDVKNYRLDEPMLDAIRIMLSLRSYSGLDDQLVYDTWKKRNFKRKVVETKGVGSQYGTDAATNVAMDPGNRFNYKSLPRDIENSEMDIPDRKDHSFKSGEYVTSNADRAVKWKPKLYKKNTELLYFLKLKYFMSSRSPGMIPSMVQDARAFVNKNDLTLNKDMYEEITNTIMQAFLLDSQELTFRSLMKNNVALDAISHLNDTNGGNLGKTFFTKRFNANSLCTKIKHAATCMVTQDFPEVAKPLKI